jgi:hypothetical protein
MTAGGSRRGMLEREGLAPRRASPVILLDPTQGASPFAPRGDQKPAV